AGTDAGRVGALRAETPRGIQKRLARRGARAMTRLSQLRRRASRRPGRGPPRAAAMGLTPSVDSSALWRERAAGGQAARCRWGADGLTATLRRMTDGLPRALAGAHPV